MKNIDPTIIRALIDAAGQSPRGRSHYLMHADHSDAVQRLCVACEPRTYIRPHKHPAGIDWEMFLLLRGRATALVFDDIGCCTDLVELDAQTGSMAVEIPTQRFHTIYVKQAATLLFEVKPGPHTALNESHFAPWAPAEGHNDVPAFLTKLRALSVGDTLTLSAK
jgi:cupin fold WbuC family metalloprotein